MSWVERLRRRLRLLFRKDEVERELDEEVRLHVEMETEELVRRGMSPADARREALRRFGGVERTKERVRDARGGRIVEDILQDLRYALRTLRRSPGFAAAVLLTLGLGIGANTAIFTVVDGVLLRPLPFDAPDRIVYLTRPGQDEGDVSLPDARDWRSEATTLETVGLFMSPWALDLTGRGTPERLDGHLAEPELFEVFGAPPVAGRYFDEAESRPGADPVVVLSEGFWRRRFGGDPALLGRTLTLNDRPFTVVGIAPGELDVFRTGVDAWVPAAAEAPWAVDERGTNNFNAVGRLAAGATLDQARAEMRALSGRLAEAHPRTNAGKIVEPVPLRDFLVADARPALLLLLGAVGLVLLIACVNLANLLLVRATRRDAEIAVRRALGGSRGRIARQLLWESGLLALGGGAIGILLSRAGTEALLALAPRGLSRADAVTIDGGVLAFALGLVAGTTLLCGLVPALYSARRDPASALQSERRGATPGRGHQRFLDGLVVAEISLALVLLVGAGLLTQSYRNLRVVDLGFEPEGRVALNLTLPESEYGRIDPQNRFFLGAIDALDGLPGVESAAFVIGAPLAEFGHIGQSVLFADRPGVPESEQPGARNRPVLGDYFETAGIPVIRGRGITTDDDGDAPRVAVVNERFAERFWPGDEPLEKRIAWRPPEGDEPRWMTVVGVVSDVRTGSVAGSDPVTVYTPYRQRAQPWQRFGTVVVRSRPGVQPDPAEIREAIWAVDSEVPVPTVTPMTSLVDSSLSRERFSAKVLLVFGIAALLIAVQGIYGVLSYVVAARRGELGIRMALGAGRKDVVALVLRRATVLTGAGVILGLGAAFALSGLLESLLYGIAATEIATFLGAAASLLVTALVAAGIPALRAARGDAASALRAD